MSSSSITIGTTRESIPTTNAQGPYRVEFRVPGKSVELPVHIEFKDVRLR